MKTYLIKDRNGTSTTKDALRKAKVLVYIVKTQDCTVVFSVIQLKKYVKKVWLVFRKFLEEFSLDL